MPSKRIVDASPLILLSKVGRLELLRIDGCTVVVPRVVLAEVEAKGADDPVAQAVAQTEWLTIASDVVTSKAVIACRIDAGETAVLSLAFGAPKSEVVLDDLVARNCARRLGIPYLGTLGLVLPAQRIGEIPEARPVVEQLRQAGLYLNDELGEEVLGRLGE